jgi:hypothetical protein
MIDGIGSLLVALFDHYYYTRPTTTTKSRHSIIEVGTASIEVDNVLVELEDQCSARRFKMP